MPYWSGAMLQLLEMNNVEYPADIIKTITPLGDIGSANYFRDTFGVQMSIEELLFQMNSLTLPKYLDKIQLKKGVLRYLNQLKKTGPV